MSDAMYPDVATYWHRTASGRTAAWERISVPETGMQRRDARTRMVGGDSTTGTNALRVPARHAGLCNWAIGDRYVRGDVAGTEPPDTAVTVSYVEPVYLAGRLDHVEMGGE